MKIAVLCDSLLLKRCLEIFLKEHLSSYRECDFIVSDKPVESEKPVFIISSQKNAHLKKPFSKAKLLKSLEEYYRRLKGSQMPPIEESSLKGDELEKRLMSATMRFVKEILEIIKEQKG